MCIVSPMSVAHIHKPVALYTQPNHCLGQNNFSVRHVTFETVMCRQRS